MSNNTPQSIAEILANLPPEQRAIIEASLKRTAQAKGFQHVSYADYYDVVTVEGRETRRPSGIENPNNLKISYTKKLGRRNTGFGINRQRDSSYTLNSFSAPVESISVGRDNKVVITMKDTFTEDEKKFIATWQKSKYIERPAPSAPSTETTTTEEPPTTESPTETAKPTATATVSEAQIKVALIKTKKLKPTPENISLVHDLMTEGGYTLDKAVTELAS